MIHSTPSRSSRAAEKGIPVAVSVYVNFNHSGNRPGYLIPQHSAMHEISIYVNLRHEVKVSYYLIPPDVQLVNIVIENTRRGYEKVEILDNSLQTVYRTEATGKGNIIIYKSCFLNSSCNLRFNNGRIICMSIDKWPDILPPFLLTTPV